MLSIKKSWPIKIVVAGLIMLLIATACGPSQEELDATATSEAEAAFATQTAEAPTSTPVPTNTPVPPTATPLPTATPSPTPPPSESTLENAFAALEEADSYHMFMDMSMEIGITGLTVELNIDFDGDYQAPDRLAGTYNTSFLGETTTFETIIVNDVMYVKDADTGEWIESPDQSAVSLSTPFSTLQPADYDELTFVGEEMLNGEAVYRFSGLVSNLDEQFAQNLDLADLGGLFTSVELSEGLVADFWTGVDDDLLRQTLVSGDLIMQTDAAETGFDEMAMTMNVLVQYSDYNEPVSIEIPEVSAPALEEVGSGESILSALPPDAPTLHISPDGSGDFPDIASALVDMEPGTTIELASGTYNLSEPIVIEQSMRLVGAGLEETTIVSTAPDWAVVFVGDGPFILQDMSVFHTGNESADAVVVIDGLFLLSDCQLSGADYLTDDDIGAGAKLLGTARGEVNRCVANNNEAGIAVADQSIVDLTNNTCSDNEFVGIVFFGESSGTATANECLNNGTDGVQVWDTASPILNNNVLSFNDEAGIAYFDESAGEATGNDCSANGLYGIYVDNFSGPYLERNRCNENADSGFVFFGESFAVAVNNECSDNDFYGMIVADAAAPILTENDCNRNGDSGLANFDESSAIISSNECAENLIGIYVQETASPDLNNNNCHDNVEADIEDEREPVDEAALLPIDRWPS